MKDIYAVLHSLGTIELDVTETLIDLLPGNVFVADKKGILLWGNQRILDALNLKDVNEYIGKHISHWDHHSWQYCQAILDSGKEIIEEEVYQGHYYVTKRKPLFSACGEIVAILGVALDITEQKQADLAKQSFLQNMAHDIRTPLAGIIGLAQLQEVGHLKTHEDSREYGKMIHGAGKQLLALLNAVIKTIDSERMIDWVKVQPLHLVTLAEELQGLMMPSIVKDNLYFRLHLDEKLPIIQSDKVQLKCILVNLLSNAVKFTQVGEVSLSIRLSSVESNHAHVEITVSDTGIGIAKDKLDKIFERFYRIYPSYEGKYSGYGLGLHLVKEGVKALDGQIKVFSEEGKGSKFVLNFKFPIANESVSEAQPVLHMKVKAKSKLINKGRVLIAEDNTLACVAVTDLLKEAGYTVVATSDGNSALEALKKALFVWALLDIGLPKLQGMKVCQRYRVWEKENKKFTLPIFALTGHCVEEIERECQAAGINHTFTKPFCNEILEKIESFVNKRS